MSNQVNDENVGLLRQLVTTVQKKNDKEKVDNSIKMKPAKVIGVDEDTYKVFVYFIDDTEQNAYTFYNKSGEVLSEGDNVRVYYTTNPAKGWIGARCGETNVKESTIYGGEGVGRPSPWDKTSEYFNSYDGDDMNIAGNSASTGRYFAHAEGLKTQATGEFSHAEGCECKAIGMGSHVEGMSNTAIGRSSHVEGEYCTTGDKKDSSNTTKGQGSHVEGSYCQAIGRYSHAEGSKCITNCDYSHAEGSDCQTIGSGMFGHAEGSGCIVNNMYGHAEGCGCTAGYYSHAEGDACVADAHSHAEGFKCKAQNYSHSEGYMCETITYSHAEGYGCKADGSGGGAHAEGFNSIANATSAHAEGNECTANGYASHAGGNGSVANGNATFVHGRGLIGNAGEVVLGKYNEVKAENDYTSNYLFIIGNGTDDENRSNAFAVDKDGNIYCNSVNAQSGGNITFEPYTTDEAITAATTTFNSRME